MKKKKIKDIAAIRRLLRKAARKACSFTVAASARAALAAVLEGVYTFEHVSPYRTEVRATVYVLDLGGKRALLVHYGLVSEWGSLDFNHVEEGIALYDPFLGELRLLSYWGQHAGEDSFMSDLPSLKEELTGPDGPLGALRRGRLSQGGHGPLGRNWQPRMKYPEARPLRRPRRLRRGAA